MQHFSGVLGDLAFPVDDAIAEHRDIEWVGSSEINTAYSADGYARGRGVGTLTTTLRRTVSSPSRRRSTTAGRCRLATFSGTREVPASCPVSLSLAPA
ncbi:hypothetical protein ACWDE0_22730 [Streptomyces sp. 900105755]